MCIRNGEYCVFRSTKEIICKTLFFDVKYIFDIHYKSE